MQLIYSSEELLKSHKVYEPVVFNGVICHGGYDEDGNYFSPRTLYRNKAIENWRENFLKQNKEELINIPISEFEPHYPNSKQMSFLLSQGIYNPFIATLTRIGVVEGYGSLLRYVAVESIESYFDQDISELAVGHLNKGLIEAHARDESGFEEQAGHSKMWPLIRDLLFDQPLRFQDVNDFLKKVNLIQDEKGLQLPQNFAINYEPLVPQIDPSLEILIRRLISVLLIELRAFRVFKWAQEVIASSNLSNLEAASMLVSFIRQDETPHVGYLTTVLSELKTLDFLTNNGQKLQGKPIIDKLLKHGINESKTVAEARNIKMVSDEISLALSTRKDAQKLLEEFLGLSDREIPPELLPKVLN